MTYTLSEGFTCRPATMDDVEAVFALITTVDIALYGKADAAYTIDDLRSGWLSTDFALAKDSWVVLAPTGQVVGSAAIWNNQHARLFTHPIVLPAYTDTGIFFYLLALAEERAKQHVTMAAHGTRVTFYSVVSSRDELGQQRLEQAGLLPVRSSWEMEITMVEPPPSPRWPEGIVVRTFVPEKDTRATFDTIDEAFMDHWGHIPGNFAWWKSRLERRTDFDPSLWFLACEGDEIAGILLCDRKSDNIAWVDDLAVRRPWRRKGLGMALLQHSFGECYRRGIHTVGLDVDAQNLTGATRLYERGGMHVVRQYNTYEKELRPGRELSTQTLEV